MDVDEIKADLTEATDEALHAAADLASAVESGDLEFAANVASRVRAALHRVKCLRRKLTLEVAG